MFALRRRSWHTLCIEPPQVVRHPLGSIHEQASERIYALMTGVGRVGDIDEQRG